MPDVRICLPEAGIKDDVTDKQRRLGGVEVFITETTVSHARRVLTHAMSRKNTTKAS